MLITYRRTTGPRPQSYGDRARYGFTPVAAPASPAGTGLSRPIQTSMCMDPRLGETFVIDIITSDPSTLAALDADSAPTAEVFEALTDAAILPLTAVKRTGKTGDYRLAVACTTANGFDVNTSYSVVVTATIGGSSFKHVAGSFILRAVPGVPVVVRSGTAQGGGATSITLDAGASAVDDDYKNLVVKLTGGTGAGQMRRIPAYAGSTKVATVVSPWVAGQVPDTFTTFDILQVPVADVTLVNGSQAAPVAVMDANVTQLGGSATAAAQLKAQSQACFLGVVLATGTTTSFTASLAANPGLATVNGYYSTPNSGVVFTTGANPAKLVRITAYAYSSGVGTFTVEPLPAAPGGGDTFVIIGKA